MYYVGRTVRNKDGEFLTDEVSVTEAYIESKIVWNLIQS
jgi:hypothetical protein